MHLARMTAAMAVGALAALAPAVGLAAKPIPKPPHKTLEHGSGKSGSDIACMKWLGQYLRTGDKDMVVDEKKVRLLWHEPETKPGKFLKKKLGKFKGEEYWDSVESQAGKDGLECRILMGLDQEIGKQGWIHGIDLYARFDLVKEGSELEAGKVTIILEYDQNEKTGEIFERNLVDCNIGPGGFVPEKMCHTMTIHDTPKGGPDSEIWTTRDLAEVLVFTKSGHLASYTLLGMMVQKDDGMAPIGGMDVVETDLQLGTKVLEVVQEKVKHLSGKGDCAAYMTTATLTYYILDGKDIEEIFSQVVDVFPDAPCWSDAKLDMQKDLIVDVMPECNDPGPCDLLLQFDQATPKPKFWSELWKWDGKKYKKGRY